MRWILRAIYLLIAVVIIAFFHYTLPQRDIVRIVGTYEERQDFGSMDPPGARCADPSGPR